MQKNKKISVSFEFFPPKTPAGMQHLMEAAIQLAEYQPQFFSVTFGAGGSTRQGTLEAVKMLQEKTLIKVAPHLACIGSSRNEIIDLLNYYRNANISRLVALRGDLPSGMGNAGEFKFANQLVALIREITGQHFHIEVAAYPEMHPQASNLDDDILNLKRKYAAGANSAITQYFFNADAYFYFVEECQKQQINIPIIPGVMPINQFSSLVRFSEGCGAEIPRWIRKRLESYADDVASIKAFGLEVVYHLCKRLIEGGAQGLHFYTLNKADVTGELVQALGLVDKKQQIHALKKEMAT